MTDVSAARIHALIEAGDYQAAHAAARLRRQCYLGLPMSAVHQQVLKRRALCELAFAFASQGFPTTVRRSPGIWT